MNSWNKVHYLLPGGWQCTASLSPRVWPKISFRLNFVFFQALFVELPKFRASYLDPSCLRAPEMSYSFVLKTYLVQSLVLAFVFSIKMSHFDCLLISLYSSFDRWLLPFYSVVTSLYTWQPRLRVQKNVRLSCTRRNSLGSLRLTANQSCWLTLSCRYVNCQVYASKTKTFVDRCTSLKYDERATDVVCFRVVNIAFEAKLAINNATISSQLLLNALFLFFKFFLAAVWEIFRIYKNIRIQYVFN